MSCQLLCLFVLFAGVVVKRPVSPEELQQPGGPYVKKSFTVRPANAHTALPGVHLTAAAVVWLQVVGDALGWGFVVRGNRPCHIQAVEPRGPAAIAGMKVGAVGDVAPAGRSWLVWIG